MIKEWAEEQQQLGGSGGCAAPRQLQANPNPNPNPNPTPTPTPTPNVLQAAAAAPGVYSDVSRRLMSSMGWNGAGPLGRRGEGAAEPIMAVGYGGGVTMGLGFVDTEDTKGLIADYLAESAEEPPARGVRYSPAEAMRPGRTGQGGWLAGASQVDE